MAQRKRITNFAQAATYTVMMVAILGAVNFLANRYNKSYDSTSNKRYTLSDQTQKIAAGLTQDLTIHYWDRADSFASARDLLDRYDNLSPRIKVVYQDVDKNRTAAIAAGIQSRGTIVVEVGNKREQAKSLTEEEITGAMVRALKGGDREVCFTAGYGDGDPNDHQPEGYAAAKELIERNNYKTRVVELLPTPTIPQECTILIVGGPRRNYLSPAVDAIKRYIEGGGHALVLLNPPLKFGAQVDDNAGLDAMLAEWGVRANKDLVLDMSGVGQLFGMGPEMPIVTRYGDHAIVRGMRNMATAFPLARSLTTEPSEKATATVLLGTSDAALSTTDLSSGKIEIEKAAKGARTLGVAVELNRKEQPAVTVETATETRGRLVVLGTSRWISNEVLGFNGNRDLLMNIINWLSSDEDLIAIRPKNPEDRRLNMNARQVTLMFWTSVVGLPLLLLAAGVSVWWRRR
jgi:ABC-type uncharacterized transport system involved in gliding motility auxiliary subunit